MMKFARWLALAALVLIPAPALAALQAYQYQAVNLQNNEPLPGAVVTIYNFGTTTRATIYDMSGNPLSNPMLADQNGAIAFQAQNTGSYQAVWSSKNYISPLWSLTTNGAIPAISLASYSVTACNTPPTFNLAGTIPQPLLFVTLPMGNCATSIPSNVMPTVPTNAALMTTALTYAFQIQRTGFYAEGDSPAIVYTANSTCPYPGTQPDNGACVATSDGKYWVAILPDYAPPTIWGAHGDGARNDTLAVQAAFNAWTGRTIDLSGHIYAVGPLVCNNVISVAGSQGNQTASYGIFSGLRPTAINQTTLTINSGCAGSIFQKFGVNFGAQGANTSGGAISMPSAVPNVTFEDISVNAPCIGADLNGNTIKWSRGQITQVAGAGCVGMRIGFATTLGATIPIVSDVTLQCNQSNPGDASLEIFDAGGPSIDNIDALYCGHGTWIKPGVNQYVQWGFLRHAALGDTTVNGPVVIDTTAASAVVKGLNFVDTWAAAYTSTSTDPGVGIYNNGGGVVDGIHFNAHRTLSVPANGMTVGSGVGAVTFDAGEVCGANQLNSTYVGIELASGVSNFALRNSTDGAVCDQSSGHPVYNVKFDGSNSGIIMTGNNLYGWTTGAVSGEPVANSSQPNIIHGNAGVDDQPLTLASAATIDPGVYPMVDVTGTATVAAIGACWTGNMITLRTASAVPFSNSGGNISNSLISIPGVPLVAQCQGGYWYLNAGGCTASGSSGNLLTSNGASGCASDADASLSNGALSLGVAGSAAGSVAFANTTSGSIILAPPSGALGSGDSDTS